MPLSAAERALCAHIDARGDELLAQLSEYVAIPTGRGWAPGLEQLRGVLRRRLEALGAAIELRPGAERPEWLAGPDGDRAASDAPQPVLIARGPAPPKAARPPRVLIVGHLDTVHDPAGDFRTLSLSDGGRSAIGPGAVDMKGGLVVALAALEALAAQGAGIAWTVALNADEETGSFGSSDILRETVPGHDLGVVLEPALPGGALAISRGGSGQFMIEAFGRAAHVGRDFAEGRSAVVALAETIVALGRLSRPDQGSIVNVGPLLGGAATNIVPDHAAAWGNVRFTDDRRAKELGAAIDRLATRGEALPRLVVRRAWNRPAKLDDAAVRGLAQRAQAAASELGQALPLASTAGVCDGNTLADAGLPTLDNLGVRGGNLHRTDEFVEVASLIERARLLAVFLGRLIAVNGESPLFRRK